MHVFGKPLCFSVLQAAVLNQEAQVDKVRLASLHLWISIVRRDANAAHANRHPNFDRPCASSIMQGENARMSAFVGAIAIADLVKTTLGPKGMDKILQSVSPTSLCSCSCPCRKLLKLRNLITHRLPALIPTRLRVVCRLVHPTATSR